MQSIADASVMSKVEKYLEESVNREPSIFSAAVMTIDGFPLVLLMGKGEAEKVELAAAIASLGALSEQTTSRLGIGKYKDMTVRAGKGYLLIRRISTANVLAILADHTAQLGAISLIMNSMIRRLQRMLK